LAAGVGIAVLVIAIVTLASRPVPVTPDTNPALAQAEVLSLVAHEMRSGDAAARVINDGQVRFDDGTWYVSVGGAHYHFSQRNRIVVAEDQAAIDLQYRS
jgi:hypothetical protein